MFTLLGFHSSNFKADDGNLIDGYMIYFAVPIENNGEGWKTDRSWVKAETFNSSGLMLNDKFDISYNRFGKVRDLIIG